MHLPSALTKKPYGEEYDMAAPSREIDAWGVKHASVSKFPNIAYKSPYVNALSALRNSSVDIHPDLVPGTVTHDSV